VIYRAELSQRVLGQLGGFPVKAFDALIAVMAMVIEYPDDPIQTFPTIDPNVRRAAFGTAGLVTYLRAPAARCGVRSIVTTGTTCRRWPCRPEGRIHGSAGAACG
jgi:hypothetical protein